MTNKQEITYLLRDRIDENKWDRCIQTAEPGHIYAECFFLDTMAGNWAGLILGDYEVVMPLPFRKKWGVQYLFQPPLTPFLGVFGKNIGEETVSQFLKAIPAEFRLWDINLHPANPVHSSFQLQFRRKNYWLSLQPAYERIAASYSPNIQRNISKGIRLECRAEKNIATDEIISLSEKQYQRFAKTGKGIFDNVKKVLEHYPKQALSYGVYDRQNELLASCAFLTYQNRAYYWLVGNAASARNYGASHRLIDEFIRDHAGTNMLLDFEGSDEPSIAGFYQRFGAKLETYTAIYHSRLPFPYNLFKKLPAYYRKLGEKNPDQQILAKDQED